jgi:hypothetical protein
MPTNSTWAPADTQVDEYVHSSYIIVESSYESEFIPEQFSEHLAAEDVLTSDVDKETFTITYRGLTHTVPLSLTRHDVWITVSSIAKVIGEDYAVFIEQKSIGEESMLLFVAPRSALSAWGATPAHLVPMQLGIDYFTGTPSDGSAISIPFVGHDVPGFAADRETHAATVEGSKELMDALIGSIFTGKIDEAKLQSAAKALAQAPSVKAELGDRPASDIANELRTAFQGALSDPDLAKKSEDLRKDMNDLRALAGAAPLLPETNKPWWKFW